MSLTERQRREQALHDQWARELRHEELLVEESFTAPTALENRFVREYVGALRDLRVLDLGSGAGEASLWFAAQGARVTAADISTEQLEVLRAAAAERGLVVETCAGPAEHLPFPDATFDFVYGNGVLHHVQLKEVVPEVLRVLKPGGRVTFIEPLSYNPAIWLYRRLAESVRTPDERPLRREEIRWVTRQLEAGGHREFWIAALAIFGWFYVGERVSPAEDRYWKKVIRDGARYERLLRPLVAVDRVLSRLPGVRFLAWNTVIYGRRPPSQRAPAPDRNATPATPARP